MLCEYDHFPSHSGQGRDFCHLPHLEQVGSLAKGSGSSHAHSPALLPLSKKTLVAREGNPGALAMQGEMAPPCQATSGVP